MGNTACDTSPEPETETGHSEIDQRLRAILTQTLSLDPADVAEFDADTGLFGHLPELDSMAVAALFTAMEDDLGILIEDDDVDGEMLETYGGLLNFTEAKAASVQSEETAVKGELTSTQKEAGELNMGGPAELSDRT